MSTYVITGASRGLGFELVRQLSSDPDNTIIGLVRNKTAAEQKVSDELKDASAKIHIVTADMDSYDSIKNAATETAAITGSSIDYLIANAAYVPVGGEFFASLGTIAQDHKRLEDDLNKMVRTNITGNIELYSTFLPLVINGKVKKVVSLTSGLADINLVNALDLKVSPLYSMTKAAMNMVTAKFNAEYKKDGVLFIGISPGIVEPEGVDYSKVSQEEMAAGMEVMGAFAKYAPEFKGPEPVTLVAERLIKVWEGAGLEKGDGGAFLSHTGVPGKWL